VSPEEFQNEIDTLKRIYSATTVLPAPSMVYPVRVAEIPMPDAFWGGGQTRLLVVFDLNSHNTDRPRGLLGPEWKLPGGGVPLNASVVFEFGESWQAFSWNFPWTRPFGVFETVEAYLGRFNDHR
jgi:hypothetical protein